MLGLSFARRHRNSYYNRRCDVRVFSIVLTDFVIQVSYVFVCNFLIRQDDIYEDGWQLKSYKTTFEALFMFYFVITYMF